LTGSNHKIHFDLETSVEFQIDASQPCWRNLMGSFRPRAGLVTSHQIFTAEFLDQLETIIGTRMSVYLAVRWIGNRAQNFDPAEELWFRFTGGDEQMFGAK